MRFVASIGRRTITTFRKMLYGFGFFYQVIKEAILYISHRQVSHRVLTMQILFTSIGALNVVMVISLSLGAVIIIQGISLLPQFGQGDLIYSILVTVITRELGPLLTAFIIIARSATAIAAELGNMVVSHEIEAYVSIGINPISFLVVPRFLGVTISMIVLNLYFNLFGLGGSFLLSQFIKPTPFLEYFRNLIVFLRLEDIASTVVKCLVFGIIISTVATYNGLNVEYSSTEIPKFAIKAVGQGFVYCILANAIITLVYYL